MGEDLTLSGLGFGSAGALQNVSGTSTWTGAITLSGAAATSVDVNGDGRLDLNGPISGGGLIKSGTGTLALGGANTYTGTTTVSAGILLGNGDGTFGATGAGNETIVNSGATLQLGDGFSASGESLSLSGTGIFGTGALHSSSSNIVWTGSITLSG